MVWQLFAAQAVASLYSGYKSSQAQREGGEAAREASYLNASDLRDLAHSNASAYRAAGAVNAGAIRTIGEANALAVENKTARNILLYGLQATEDRRRHVLNEQLTAGTIRAMGGASGVQTNTGSPLHYLNAQVDLGIRERRYGDIKAYWTVRNMKEEGEEQAHVIRLTADQQAMVTEYNASLQAELSLAESLRQATAMERSGDVQAATGAAQGSAAMWGGIGNAVGAGADAYSSYVNQPPAYNYTGSAYSNSWTMADGYGVG